LPCIMTTHPVMRGPSNVLLALAASHSRDILQCLTLLRMPGCNSDREGLEPNSDVQPSSPHPYLTTLGLLTTRMPSLNRFSTDSKLHISRWCDNIKRDMEEEKPRELSRQTLPQQVSEQVLSIPHGYQKVAVLIIRWDEKIDDFAGHNEEVHAAFHRKRST
jgi:hypothetical protein